MMRCGARIGIDGSAGFDEARPDDEGGLALTPTANPAPPTPANTLDRYLVPAPPGVIIRPRQRADIPDLFDLFNERSFLDNASTHGSFDSYDAFEDWLNGVAPAGRYEIVAQVGTNVVGFGGLYAFPELMSHCGSLILGVREDWQQQKIGSTILRILLMNAEIMVGLSKIHLTVFAHNTAALRLYSDFGFEVEGLLKRFSRRGDGFSDAYSLALFFDRLAVTKQTA